MKVIIDVTEKLIPLFSIAILISLALWFFLWFSFEENRPCVWFEKLFRICQTSPIPEKSKIPDKNRKKDTPKSCSPSDIQKYFAEQQKKNKKKEATKKPATKKPITKKPILPPKDKC